MKALIVCPDCGYQMIGVGVRPSDAERAAYAGMEMHRASVHPVVVGPRERWIVEPAGRAR
jgi:hypothetical protein